MSLRLIEWGKALQVNLTVEDPGAFNDDWTAIVVHRHVASATLRKNLEPKTTPSTFTARPFMKPDF
jgi:hypothetical protein